MKDKRTLPIFLCLFITMFSVSTTVNASSDVEVINWGQDRLSCSATCTLPGPEVVDCIANGNLTSIVTDEVAMMACNDGEWLLEPLRRAGRGTINCGNFGTGQYVVTPSGKVNWTCHIVFGDS